MIPPPAGALSDKLAAGLKAANLSRSRLASLLAIDKSVVSRWLSGAVTPSEHNLTRLTELARKTWPEFSLSTWELPPGEFARALHLGGGRPSPAHGKPSIAV